MDLSITDRWDMLQNELTQFRSALFHRGSFLLILDSGPIDNDACPSMPVAKALTDHVILSKLPSGEAGRGLYRGFALETGELLVSQQKVPAGYLLFARGCGGVIVPLTATDLTRGMQLLLNCLFEQ